MEWSGQKEFVSSPEVPFTVDDSEAGLLKNYGPLSFLKVCISLIPTSNPLPAHTNIVDVYDCHTKQIQTCPCCFNVYDMLHLPTNFPVAW